jgi:hypothetical protein
MKETPIKNYIKYLFGVEILVFVLNKYDLKPWVLANDARDALAIFVFSIPNLVEAIVGTLIITGILFQTKDYFKARFGHIKDIYIHVLAVSMASIYVLMQELKFHNLGGNNIYDPYDVLASIVGLVFTFSMIQWVGFKKFND